MAGRTALKANYAQLGRFSANQEALIELAKEAKRDGISVANAATLMDWADELQVTWRDDIGTSHWVGGDHIHIGPIDHIPVGP